MITADLLSLVASRETLELRAVNALREAGCPDTEARDAARALLARAARDASADPHGTFEMHAEMALARIGSRTGPLPPAALPRTVAVAPTPAPEPAPPSVHPYTRPPPRAPSGDPWTAFVADILALQGADLSRALPLGGVTPGGGGGEPAELLARVARGDVARARAALRRLAGCSPTVVAGLAEVLTPGITQDEAAARYACHYAPLALRDGIARAEDRERTARLALEQARTARRGHARRSLADPARESIARLVEDRARAAEEAAAGAQGARGKVTAWGREVVAGELARYDHGRSE